MEETTQVVMTALQDMRHSTDLSPGPYPQMFKSSSVVSAWRLNLSHGDIWGVSKSQTIAFFRYSSVVWIGSA